MIRSPEQARRRIVVSSLALVVVLGLVVAALVRATSFEHTTTTAMPRTISTPGFLRPTMSTPPRFSLTELGDPAVSVTLAHYAGKPLILNFWSSTCSVCASEAAALAAADKQLGARVAFVGIDTAEASRANGIAFARQHHMGYPLLFDGSAAVADRYGLPGLPVTFFVSSSGKLIGENLGALTVHSLDGLAHRLFGIRLA